MKRKTERQHWPALHWVYIRKTIVSCSSLLRGESDSFQRSAPVHSRESRTNPYSPFTLHVIENGIRCDVIFPVFETAFDAISFPLLPFPQSASLCPKRAVSTEIPSPPTGARLQFPRRKETIPETGATGVNCSRDA